MSSNDCRSLGGAGGTDPTVHSWLVKINTKDLQHRLAFQAQFEARQTGCPVSSLAASFQTLYPLNKMQNQNWFTLE